MEHIDSDTDLGRGRKTKISSEPGARTGSSVTLVELILPAGSQEAVAAAVQNGADAVYAAVGGRRLGRDDNSFSHEEFEYAARYCRVRGCRIYAELDFFAADSEIAEAADLARSAAMLGADGIIVHDLGLMRALSRAAPELQLIAGQKMGLDNAEAVSLAITAGASRVILADTLDLERISRIAETVKVIVPVHGELCVSKRGNCFFGSMTLEDLTASANRGSCPKLCRSDLSMGGRMDYYPLSMRDLCLAGHIEELRQAGVDAVVIGGRDKRPEYTAALTEIYARLVHEGSGPTEEDLRNMDELLSGYGLTDGYFSGKEEIEMAAPRREMYEASRVFQDIRRGYTGRESRRVPIKIYAVIRGTETLFGAEDALGNRAAIRGGPPQRAGALTLTEPALEEVFYRTGGTPYFVEDVSCIVEPELFIPPETLESIRRELLARLSDSRMQMRELRFGTLPLLPDAARGTEKPLMNIEVRSSAQLSPGLAEKGFHILYIPLESFVEDFHSAAPFVEAGTKIAVTLPHSLSGDEEDELRGLLRRARELGASEALLRNTGHLNLALDEGFSPRGDVSFNVYNSYTLKAFEEAGLISAALPYELSFGEVAAMNKSLDTELIVYGRLPVMFTERCIINRSLQRHGCRSQISLSSRDGALYPLMREFGCRNVIYSSEKLFLADRRADYEALGLWAVRLLYTTENARECVRIAESYLSEGDYEPNGTTRGLYY